MKKLVFKTTDLIQSLEEVESIKKPIFGFEPLEKKFFRVSPTENEGTVKYEWAKFFNCSDKERKVKDFILEVKDGVFKDLMWNRYAIFFTEKKSQEIKIKANRYMKIPASDLDSEKAIQIESDLFSLFEEEIEEIKTPEHFIFERGSLESAYFQDAAGGNRPNGVVEISQDNDHPLIEDKEGNLNSFFTGSYIEVGFRTHFYEKEAGYSVLEDIKKWQEERNIRQMLERLRENLDRDFDDARQKLEKHTSGLIRAKRTIKMLTKKGDKLREEATNTLRELNKKVEKIGRHKQVKSATLDEFKFKVVLKDVCYKKFVKLREFQIDDEIVWTHPTGTGKFVKPIKLGDIAVTMDLLSGKIKAKSKTRGFSFHAHVHDGNGSICLGDHGARIMRYVQEFQLSPVVDWLIELFETLYMGSPYPSTLPWICLMNRKDFAEYLPDEREGEDVKSVENNPEEGGEVETPVVDNTEMEQGQEMPRAETPF